MPAFNLAVNISGFIGAGKSHALDFLEKRLSSEENFCSLSKEPLSIWNHSGSHRHILGLFDAYVKYPEIYTYQFQNLVFATHLMLDHQSHQDAKNMAKYFKRSILLREGSVKHSLVFTEANARKFMMSEFACVKEFASEIDLRVTQPDFTVYVDTPFSTCLERMKQRNRPNECKYDTLFLEELYSRFEQMKLDIPTDKIIVVKSDTDLENCAQFLLHKLYDKSHLGTRIGASCTCASGTVEPESGEELASTVEETESS